MNLLKLCLTIENEMGRKREQRWGSRIIDIDILYFDDAVMTESNLVIPHPEIHNRDFVLQPMLELLQHRTEHNERKALLESAYDRLAHKCITAIHPANSMLPTCHLLA